MQRQYLHQVYNNLNTLVLTLHRLLFEKITLPLLLKGFQHGGDALREKGYPIHSLAVIEEATPDHITFREDDPV